MASSSRRDEAAAARRRTAAARYRPDVIDLLLVAEAPPSALDRYFYFEDVLTHDSLFRHVVEGVLGDKPTRDKAPYLDEMCRILLISVGAYDHAYGALRAAGLPVIDARLPFPGSGQQRRFLEGFRLALAQAG